MTIPLTITLPKGAMPATGWPLYQFFHGSGGLSTGVVDVGPSPDSSDMPTPGKGPGYVVALHGIAAASARDAGQPRAPASTRPTTAYLNINNLTAFPHTFQQGVFEQRMFLDALLALHIPPSRGRRVHRHLDADGRPLLRPAEARRGRPVDGRHVHEHGRRGRAALRRAGADRRGRLLEPDDPRDQDRSRCARAARHRARRRRHARSRSSHPAMRRDGARRGSRPSRSSTCSRAVRARIRCNIYEPVGKDDSYFPTNVYDAAALAYGNQQAGDRGVADDAAERSRSRTSTAC